MTTPVEDGSPSEPRRRCPICQREFVAVVGLSERFLPFCSERCRQADLFRWMDGRYAIVDPVTDPELLDEIVDRLEREGS